MRNANESDKEKAGRILKKTIEHKQEWLDKLRANQEAVPLVQKSLDADMLQYDLLKSAPPEVPETEFGPIASAVDLTWRATKKALPLPPKLNPDYLGSMVTISTSGTAPAIGLVQSVARLATDPAVTYVNEYTMRLESLQQSQERTGEVRKALVKLKNRSIIDRFEEAEKAYFAAKSQTGKTEAAGNAIRILVDGVKGELFELARNNPKENMTWQIMTDRLSKGKAKSPEHEALLTQGYVRSQIYSELSTVSKNREGGLGNRSLELIWAAVLEHINAVLGLILI
ncbi:MAG: hypothetical protein M1305_00710 [Candidatus Marsarchaeota archaeon]|nr:hypothetical protein [Candidatus Marsarchaeota archaeon]